MKGWSWGDDKDDDVKRRGAGFEKKRRKTETPAPPHQEWMSYEMERSSEQLIQLICRQNGDHDA